jgi:hypothetical protein
MKEMIKLMSEIVIAEKLNAEFGLFNWTCSNGFLNNKRFDKLLERTYFPRSTTSCLIIEDIQTYLEPSFTIHPLNPLLREAGGEKNITKTCRCDGFIKKGLM